jgi:sterol desaturase/sphingolipid hydroxylase (fatty acid hydroxylase superfamily)
MGMQSIRKLWQADLRFSQRWRPFTNFVATGYALAFGVAFLPLFFSTTFAVVGASLGEPVSFGLVRQQFLELWSWAQAGGHQAFFAGVVLLVASALFSRALAGLRAYWLYRGEDGERFPLDEFWTYMGLNLLGLVGTLATGLAIWAVARWNGVDLGSAMQALVALGRWAHVQVDTHIPTLVDLPGWLAILPIFVLAGLLHYLAHAASHIFRAPWLLFHRVHHMPEVLSAHTTTPVFFAIPLLIVVVVPYNFVFAATTKLFAAEPLYLETLILSSLAQLIDPWAHATALYQEARRNKFLRWMSLGFMTGAYHAMHHSSDPTVAGRRKVSNMVNLGGLGCPFGIWDRLFGTFVELSDETPVPGLTRRPRLAMNPLRLAFAGMLQMAYELRWNKGWTTRLWVVFGPASWDPPISKDFALAVAPQHDRSSNIPAQHSCNDAVGSQIRA